MNANLMNLGHVRWVLAILFVVLLVCLVASPTSPAMRLSMSLTALHAALLIVALTLRGRGPAFFRRVVVGRRGGRRLVCWCGLLCSTVALVTILVLVSAVGAAIVGFEPAWLAVAIGAGLGLLVAGGGLGVGLLTPLDELTPIE